MIGTDESTQLALAIRDLAEGQQRGARELAALVAQVGQLVSLLVARGVLAEGHRKHLERVVRHDDGTPERRVRLRLYIDKYNMNEGEPIDCAARMPLCHARCCTFQIELSAQDVEEGRLRWDLLRPYMLRKEADRYCTYLDRGNGQCTVHAHRPATCREYSCRNDRRVWLDFEQRIPAPMPVAPQPSE